MKVESMKGSDNVVVTVRGKVAYAQVHEPGQPFAGQKAGNFSLLLGVTDDIRLKLEQLGLQTAKDKAGNEKSVAGLEGLSLFNIKRKSINSKGKVIENIPVTLEKTGELTKELVGNGSEITARFIARKFSTPFIKNGTTTDLLEVTIHDLVEYKPKAAVATTSSNAGAVDDEPF